MDKYREFLAHARECDRLAKGASDPDVRQQWDRLAQTWRSLAEERRKMFKLPPEPERKGAAP
jgi:hypothetical protein